MAVINKLRSSGWVIIVILLALVLFVVSDLVSNWQKMKGGGNTDVVGVINGENIKYQDYNNEVKFLESRMEANGTALDAQQRDQIKDQVWENMFRTRVIQSEYDKIGLQVGADELKQLLYSPENAHPYMKQYFVDQNTGMFSPALVQNFMKTRYTKDANAHFEFDELLKQIKDETVSRKYLALVRNGIYATKLDADAEYDNSSVFYNGKIVSLDYNSIPDKDIKVTDAELQAYLDKHKDEYKQEKARNLEYVSWNVAPSAADTAEAKKLALNRIEDFKTTPNDTVYVEQYSEGVKFDGSFRARGTGAVSPDIEEIIFNAPKDSVIGPIYTNGGYSLYKILDTKDDSVYYMRASQITIPIKGSTEQDTMNAIAEGKKLMAEAKSASSFDNFAKEKATQGYLVNNGNGDMGWWRDGNQIKQVNDFVKKANKGDVGVIKTPYGIQLVKVTENKTKKLVAFAEVHNQVVAQNSTIEETYKKASAFRQTLTTGANDAFSKQADKQSVALRVAPDVTEQTKVLPGISEAKEIVRWAYSDKTKLNDISQVFSVDNKQVIVHLADIKEEGTAKLKDVKDKIEKEVVREKKAELLKKKFTDAMATAKSPEDLAIALKTVAQPIDRLTFNAGGVPYAGNDIKLVGYVTGLKEKTMGKPFASTDGVHVAYLTSIVKSDKSQLPPQNKSLIYSDIRQNAQRYIFNAFKTAADIKDYRFRFY